MIAAKCKDADIVKLLLEKGANVNVKTKDGRTALNLAKAKNDLGFYNWGDQEEEVVQLLKKAGAKE